MTAVTLPRYSWGDASAGRSALVVHGLGSNGPSTWRIGTDLAERGWHVTAVDLRGHGLAPRTLDYRLERYGADVAGIAPLGGGSWNLVVGHSLGGAASALAASANPGWAERLALLDPAIVLQGRDAERIANSQRAAFDDNSPETVRRRYPNWHEQDIELKVQAVSQASRWAIEQTLLHNTTWDVREAVAALTVPVFVIAADPGIHSLCTGALAAELLQRNAKLSMTVIAGAGHNLHRDRPEQTTKTIADWAEHQLRG